IAQRVILDMHRQALVGRVQARSLGHGPADQGPVQLQAEVVVQPPGGVFLDDETQRRAEAALSGRITSWLPGLVEITLAVVFTQGSGHGGLLSVHPDFFLRLLLLWLVDLPPPALPPLPLPPRLRLSSSVRSTTSALWRCSSGSTLSTASISPASTF